MGKAPVSGIGLVEDGDPVIAFLLERDSVATRKAIVRWALERHVLVRVLVTGVNRPV